MLAEAQLTISIAGVSSEAGGGSQRCPRKAVIGNVASYRPRQLAIRALGVTWPSLTVYTTGMAGTGGGTSPCRLCTVGRVLYIDQYTDRIRLWQASHKWITILMTA